MNVSEQIISVLDDLCRRFGVVIDWTKDNIAPSLEELAGKFVAYEAKTSWFWIYFTIAMSTVIALIGLLIWKVGDDISGLIILEIIAIFLLFIVCGTQIYDLITCEVFPEKILLREIKELLDSASMR